MGEVCFTFEMRFHSKDVIGELSSRSCDPIQESHSGFTQDLHRMHAFRSHSQDSHMITTTDSDTFTNMYQENCHKNLGSHEKCTFTIQSIFNTIVTMH